jgi:hypothetical protein
MRYHEIIDEAGHPDTPYYHGTASIMQNGLHPPDFAATGRAQETNLRPQAGYVYLTPHLRYAFNYAMGFHMEERDRAKLRIPYDGNERRFDWVIKRGRFAYLFVVHASTISSDLHPDEDAVGALYEAAISGQVHWWLEGFLPKAIFDKAKADPDMLKLFASTVERGVSSVTRAKLADSQNSTSKIGWAAKVGKIALRKMDGPMKQWLIQIGCHAGHSGTLRPDECWRFPRVEIGWLEPDASNFFDLAEQIA